MTLEQENFVITLTDACQTHAEWLAVMRFGLLSLLDNQPLLIECIIREAQREAAKCAPSYQASDMARRIFEELNLRFEVTPAAGEKETNA